MAMTLREALETDEVKEMLANQIRESVQEVVADLDVGEIVKGALAEQLPALRESVASSLRQTTSTRELSVEAHRLIEATKLKGAAKQNLLDDYALFESGKGDPKPGRALALVEAEMDEDGTTVKKTALQVLQESVNADVERTRAVLKESAPSVPISPGGGGEHEGAPLQESAPDAGFLAETSKAGQFLRERGMDPAQFGAPKTTTA